MVVLCLFLFAVWVGSQEVKSLSKLSDRCPFLFKEEFWVAWADGDSSKGSEHAVIKPCGVVWPCCPSGRCAIGLASAVPKQQPGECSLGHVLSQPQPCVNGLFSACKMLSLITSNCRLESFLWSWVSSTLPIIRKHLRERETFYLVSTPAVVHSLSNWKTESCMVFWALWGKRNSWAVWV